MEKTALAQRSLAERIGDVIAVQAGRMWFIIIHVVWFTLWIVLNINPHAKSAFDPFPFPFLTMIVSLESIFFVAFHPDERESEWLAGGPEEITSISR